MSEKIVQLPNNIIGLEDKKKLESYGAHQIGRGRATRYCWTWVDENSPVIEIFRGGADEELVLTIGRDQENNIYIAKNAEGLELVSGSLDHVMAIIDKQLAEEHGE